jgi:aspartate/methionine/tyrosine aminotransferase
MESIVTAAGTTFANHLAMATLIDPGDEVIIEQPTYEPLLALARYLGAEVRRVPRRFEAGFQIDLDELEHSISSRTRLIVLTNLHNPSGVHISNDTLKQIGDVAKQVGARVLVDEVYLESFFKDRPRTAFHLGPEFVVTSSLTKAFGLSGLRCGWIVAEESLAERMWLLNDLFASTPVHVGERLSVAALHQLDSLAAEANALLKTNRELVERFLDSRKDIDAVRPTAGTVVFPKLARGSGDAFCSLLARKYETSVVPGRFFEMPQHFRLGMGGDTETLEAGLERLGHALDES